jgi:mono/diheme cytochrome c family protein
MRFSKTLLFALVVLALTGLLAANSWTAPEALALQAPTPDTAITPLPTVSGSPGHHEGQWIIVNLPPDAPQVSVGAEIYRLVCRDCHGNRGQGLTPEWRATWAPADQNCWQSKCHGPNHPEGGFQMPYSPPVTGVPFTGRFGTAQDLFNFIRQNMPWYAPGSLTDEQAWAASALLLQMNGLDPGVRLDGTTAAAIIINAEVASRPTTQPPAVTPDTGPKSGSNPSTDWLIGGTVLIVAVILAGLALLGRKVRE